MYILFSLVQLNLKAQLSIDYECYYQRNKILAGIDSSFAKQIRIDEPVIIGYKPARPLNSDSCFCVKYTNNLSFNSEDKSYILKKLGSRNKYKEDKCVILFDIDTAGAPQNIRLSRKFLLLKRFNKDLCKIISAETLEWLPQEKLVNYEIKKTNASFWLMIDLFIEDNRVIVDCQTQYLW